MTLKEAVRQLKGLREYAEGEVKTYGTMDVGDDDNPWVEDVQALDIAIEVMERMQKQEEKDYGEV